ncbi:helix-turn-helix transcriptional regulator [Phenylobacterium sp.]|uniref:helix-turn-helix domain-containing protein n=1 Tax=Phenylobacterium sp. TaxID=1871053 RepID=UPI00301C4C1E
MTSNLNDPAYRTFVARLAALRTASGVTQSELAARLGRPQSYVSKIERHERRIDPAEFWRIARALGADPAAAFAEVAAGLAEGVEAG